MFSLVVLALLAQSDSGEAHREQAEPALYRSYRSDGRNSSAVCPGVVTPMATCVQASPAVVDADPLLGTNTPASGEDEVDLLRAKWKSEQRITRWLQRWERKSQKVPEMSRSQREEFRRQLHETFNEHTVAAVEQLVGQVNQQELTANFVWRIEEQQSGRVCLIATPRDETEQLFYGSLCITVTAANGPLEKIEVIDRHRDRRTAWSPEPARRNDQIRLVQFEDGIPPAPRALVQTANLRVD